MIDADWRQGRAVRGWLPKRFLAQTARSSDLADPAAAFAAFQRRRDRAVAAALERLVADLDVARVRVIAAQAQLRSLGAGAELDTVGGSVRARHLVLAVGAKTSWPEWGQGLLDPAEALYGGKGPLPRRLVVIGGGYVATAQAALLRSFGVEVTLVLPEAEPLAGFDDDLRRLVGEGLAARGVRLRPETEVLDVGRGEAGLEVRTTAGALVADRVVLASEQAPRPLTAALGLERFGVRLAGDGAVQVDVRYAASVDGLYAIGDCSDHAGQGLSASTFDLGAVAACEGEAVAERLFAATPPPPLDYDHVPLLIPGRPELAVVGLGEARARALGFAVRAAVARDDDEFVKLVVDAADGRILGCHLVGEGAGPLVQGLAMALGAGADLARLQRTVPVPHPLAEKLLALAKGLG